VSAVEEPWRAPRPGGDGRATPVVKRLLAIAALVSISVLGPWGATTAFAHAQLVSSDPAAGSTEPALPESVTLEFSTDPVDVGDGNRITVVDPQGVTISAEHTDRAGSRLSVVLHPTAKVDGVYHVSYRVVSSDGHAAEGSYEFTVSAGVTQAPVDSTTGASGRATLLVTANGAGIPKGEGSPSGSALGTFDVDLGTSTLCYRVVTRDLPDVTALHVHSTNTAAMTLSDEIYIPVDVAALDRATSVCGPQRRSDLVALVRDPSRYALVVHTRGYPEGAASGTFAIDSSEALVLPSSSPVASITSTTSPLPFGARIIMGLLVVVGVVAAVTGVVSRRRPGS